MEENARVLPPPIPARYRRRMSIGVKCLLLGLQIGFLMLCALAVWFVAYDRDNSDQRVAREISEQWGDEVVIKNPTLEFVQPAVADGNRDDRPVVRSWPERWTCDVEMQTKSLHREIYETEVYTARVMVSGRIHMTEAWETADSALFRMRLPARQIKSLSALEIAGTRCDWEQDAMALTALLPKCPGNEPVDFKFTFDIDGSSGFFVRPESSRFEMEITGMAPHPSFQGPVLPTERKIDGDEFSAVWKMDDDLVSEGRRSGAIGVKFLVGVDRYRMVSRSLKYAILIILLTYVCVLFSEILLRRPIPLLNYFLIGAALVLFYALLLSFTDRLPFWLSYLLAASMTVGLISGYLWKMLGSRKTCGLIAGLLTVLYGCCYVLLSLNDSALLLGSLLLFAALAAMMYASLRLSPRQ